MRKIFVFLLSVLILVNVYGCAALVVGAIGGAGTAIWLSGKTIQDLDHPRDKVADAARSALKTLNLHIDKDTKAKDVTQIMSRYTDDSTIWIDIRPISKNRSTIEIRVGTGNKDASRKLLEATENFL
ncbi:MAG: DUF3568 family protein [Candidatus Omnitrophota bacterium]